jgi:hypothetical protein
MRKATESARMLCGVLDAMGLDYKAPAAERAAEAWNEAIFQAISSGLEKIQLNGKPRPLSDVLRDHGGTRVPDGFTPDSPVYCIHGALGKRPKYVVIAPDGERWFAAGTYFGRESSFSIWRETALQIAQFIRLDPARVKADAAKAAKAAFAAVPVPVQVLLNAAHTLLPAQEELLTARFGDGGWELFPIPEQGWTRQEQTALAEKVAGEVVFASPVPLLLGLFARQSERRVSIFHNDRRVAREVPDGKGGVRVIHTVAPDGWELVAI